MPCFCVKYNLFMPCFCVKYNLFKPCFSVKYNLFMPCFHLCHVQPLCHVAVWSTWLCHIYAFVLCCDFMNYILTACAMFLSVPCCQVQLVYAMFESSTTCLCLISVLHLCHVVVCDKCTICATCLCATFLSVSCQAFCAMLELLCQPVYTSRTVVLCQPVFTSRTHAKGFRMPHACVRLSMKTNDVHVLLCTTWRWFPCGSVNA